MGAVLTALGIFYAIALLCLLTVMIVALASRIPGRGCFQPVDAAIGFVCLVMLPAFVGGLLWTIS